jgi:hypothetical protein
MEIQLHISGFVASGGVPIWRSGSEGSRHRRVDDFWNSDNSSRFGLGGFRFAETLKSRFLGR